MPNKIGYLLGLPTKSLDAVIYYEKYIVIQPGVMAKKADETRQEVAGKENVLDGVMPDQLLTEDEYITIMDNLPQGNEYLDDNDPNKFIAILEPGSN